VSFEAPDSVAVGLALGLLAGDVIARLGIAAGAGDGHAVDGALIWRLPQRSRRWRLVRPELAGIGAIPAARASLASVAKRPAPAISPTSLAAVSGPHPRSASSCGATWATRSAISASSALMVCEITFSLPHGQIT
jgi:hypothetical protein